jgi:hypothetical protein
MKKHIIFCSPFLHTPARSVSEGGAGNAYKNLKTKLFLPSSHFTVRRTQTPTSRTELLLLIGCPHNTVSGAISVECPSTNAALEARKTDISTTWTHNTGTEEKKTAKIRDNLTSSHVCEKKKSTLLFGSLRNLHVGVAHSLLVSMRCGSQKRNDSQYKS